MITVSNLLENDIRGSINEIDEIWGRRLRDAINKFGSASPFDFLIWNGEKIAGIECKMLRERKNSKPKSIPFSRISDTQREGLIEINNFKNSKGIILVNFRYFSGKGKCFVLPIDYFLYLEQDLDRKSIPLSVFEETCESLERYKKGWDLRLLL